MAKSRKKDLEQVRRSEPEPTPQSEHTIEPAAGRDRIAQRAYELYVARGGEAGRELDDWLAAEREVSVGAPDTKER